MTTQILPPPKNEKNCSTNTSTPSRSNNTPRGPAKPTCNGSGNTYCITTNATPKKWRSQRSTNSSPTWLASARYPPPPTPSWRSVPGESGDQRHASRLSISHRLGKRNHPATRTCEPIPTQTPAHCANSRRSHVGYRSHARYSASYDKYPLWQRITADGMYAPARQRY